MKKKILTKICLIVSAAMIISGTPAMSSKVLADTGGQSQLEREKQWLVNTCLYDIYRARAEETRIAREYLGSVRDLAAVNPEYQAKVPEAEARLRNAIAAENKARYDYQQGKASPDQPGYDLVPAQGDNGEFPSVFLNTGTSKDLISVYVPVNQPCNVVINGVKAFSLLSTGRPVDFGSMLGLIGFAEPYATYSNWHISINFYGNMKLLDSLELTGAVKNKSDFKRLNDFVQIWRPGVEGATFRIYVEDEHSIMVGWNPDGSVTITDFNKYNTPKAQSNSGKTQSSGSSNSSSSGSNSSSGSSSGSSNSDSSNSGNSSSSGSNSSSSSGSSNSDSSNSGNSGSSGSNSSSSSDSGSNSGSSGSSSSSSSNSDSGSSNSANSSDSSSSSSSSGSSSDQSNATIVTS